MTTFVPRTPLEAVLGEPLDLDLSDWEAGDLEAQDREHTEREEALLAAAIATGEFLYREAVRGSVPGLGGRAQVDPLTAATRDFESRALRSAARRGRPFAPLQKGA